jgi:hypothetical protein
MSLFCCVLPTGAFFSVLFNLQKFTLFEQRDPVYVKQELNEQGVTYVAACWAVWSLDVVSSPRMVLQAMGPLCPV